MFIEKCDLQGVPKKSGKNHNFLNFDYRIFASKSNDIKFGLNESSFDRLSCEKKLEWDLDGMSVKLFHQISQFFTKNLV